MRLSAMKPYALFAAVLLLAGSLSACDTLPTTGIADVSDSNNPETSADIFSATSITGMLDVIYLPHGYFVTGKTDEFIATEVQALAEHSFEFQFANLAAFEDDGTMDPSHYDELDHWVQVSRATDPDQQIIAYVSGHESTHVNNPDTWQNIADFCAFLINDPAYELDGIHIDFEPLPDDNPNYLALMDAIRSAIGTAAHLSVAAPLLNWSGSHINEVSNRVDMINVMNYDTGLKRQSQTQDYINLVRDETIRYSQNKRDGCQLNPLQAAYGNNRWHNSSVENIINGSDAIMQAIDAGADVDGSGVWWWFQMDDQDKQDWLTHWVQQNPS